ncbi:ABC transporter substrate-binding protein [candidate division KSB1 bacterium]|nr:ABC transporter substrate-binding protein [candidate division KSB1 bacterium]
MKRFNTWLQHSGQILILTSLIISGCSSIDSNAHKRIEKSLTNQGDIVVGLVWPSEIRKGYFVQGAQLAVEEINETGLLGRKIRLVIRDDGNNKKKARNIALEFSKNTDMIAVVGHNASGVTLPVSVIYNYSGLLFINTASTNSTLTRHNLDMFFRIIPDNQEFAKKVVEYTYLMGYRKPVIVYVRGYYGKDLSNMYQTYLGRLEVPIVHIFSYFSGSDDWREIFRDFKNLDYDIVFLAGSVPEAAHFINQARAWGITTPFIGSDGFDTNLLLNIGKASVEGSMYCGVFNPENPRAITQFFVEKFKRKYNRSPDTEAAQAFDALKLLAFIIHKSQSVNPEVLASNLIFVEKWEGVTGYHTFTRNGDVVDKTIYFKKIEKQKQCIVDIDENKITEVEKIIGGYHEAAKESAEKTIGSD